MTRVSKLPVFPPAEAEIVTRPVVTPVTLPVLSTVAIAGFDELQAA